MKATVNNTLKRVACVMLVTASFLCAVYPVLVHAEEPAILWADETPVKPPVKKVQKKRVALHKKHATPTPHKEVAVAPRSVETAPKRQLAPLVVPAAEMAMGDEPSMVSRLIGRFTTHDRLSPEDAARYEGVFAFQMNGDFSRAAQEMKKIKDPVLVGYVLSQRYLSPDYKASYGELAAWMHRYGDYAGAQKIYDLALKRKTKEDNALEAPRVGHGIASQDDFDVGQLAQPYLNEQEYTPKQKDVLRAVRKALPQSPSGALVALKRASSKKLFNDTQYDALQAAIAEAYFYNNKIDESLRFATASVQRSGKEVPMAGWIAGLSSWRMKRYADAAHYFEVVANSPRASAWMISAGAHWAARSYLRAHQPQKVSEWLYRAADYPRTFYGIISMKMLGMEQSRFEWQKPELDAAAVKALTAVPAGRRALALADAGQRELAEAEIHQISPEGNVELQKALIALSVEKELPNVALRMGGAFRDKDGKVFDVALYPNAAGSPEHGFDVDRALVYAFIRQESKFDERAVNRGSGAVGLMQIMPATARHVAKLAGMKELDEDNLKDPVYNMELGQQYLADLLHQSFVKNNLFKLAVAYNAGPGKLMRWEKTTHYADDPLLFIESIPATETRVFVERVLTNFWIYRLKFKQETDSLKKTAEGKWPLYVSQDIHRGDSVAVADMTAGQ